MEILDRVKEFIVYKYLMSEPSMDITLDTKLSEDLQLEGDDAVIFFEKFGDEFNIDLTNLNLSLYFYGEGFNPFLFFVNLFRPSIKRTITVRDLVKSVETGEWVVS